MKTGLNGFPRLVAFPLTPALSPRERENYRQLQRYPMIPVGGGLQAEKVRRSAETPLQPVMK